MKINLDNKQTCRKTQIYYINQEQDHASLRFHKYALHNRGPFV